MKNLYKLLTMLAGIVVLLVACFTITAAAGADDFVVENGVLTFYKGSESDVIIPEDLGITVIGYQAFHGRDIHSVVIPKGVMLIGSDAFQYCEKLVSVTIPDGVTTIGHEAFADCAKLAEVNIPSSVTTIGNSAFFFCTSLEAISLPDSVEAIGRAAFENTRIKTIVLPKKITSVEDCTFLGCDNLSSVDIPNGVTAIGDYAFADCGKLQKIDVPEGVSSFGYAIFYGTAMSEPLLLKQNSVLCYVPASVTSYTIPDTVTKICGGAFYKCAELTAMTIPKRITEIDRYTFYKCTKLKSVSLPDSITIIGDYAFNGCLNLTTINIPVSVLSIGENVFSLTKLSSAIYSDNGGTLCFVPASLESFDIPNTVKKISGGAFEGCYKLTKIVVPNGVRSIGNNAFSECRRLVSVTLPNSVSEIGRFAFLYCSSLLEVELPHELTQISDGLFSDCSSLKNVTLPSNVTSIGDCAFYNCKSLASINIPGKTTYIGTIAFVETALTSILIPNSALQFGVGVFRDEVTIYGHISSSAQTYAMRNNNPFISIDRTAQPSTSSIIIDGKAVALQAYTIDGNNYFKLRDLASVMSGTKKQFNVGWDGVENAIALTSTTAYSPIGGELAVADHSDEVLAVLSSAQVLIDGKEVSLTAYIIDGYNYFKLRDVGRALDFGVTWAGVTNTVTIDTSARYAE